MTAARAQGDEPNPSRPLSDLTLLNFFSAGWDEPWAKRHRASGTPDFALLRVQTNFLERELRANYFFESNISSRTRKNINSADALFAWGFNRRLMLEIVGTYQWVHERGESEDVSGGTASLVGRLQLVDTEAWSYSFNFRVAAPNEGVGDHQTVFSYGLAGYTDLAFWLPLDRVGLYYSVLFDTLAGPSKPGARRSDAGYDISVAKTFTAPTTPVVGDLTAFVEGFAQTDLDGDRAGRTLVSATPGIRFDLGWENWILLGADLPVADRSRGMQSIACRTSRTSERNGAWKAQAHSAIRVRDEVAKV